MEEIIKEFLDKYEKSIIQICIQNTMEYGPGALFVNLGEASNEIDCDYYLYEDLDKNLKKVMSKNDKLRQTIYYILVLKDKTFIYERDIS